MNEYSVLRRKLVTSYLGPNEIVVTMTNFPLLGSTHAQFLHPHFEPTPDKGASTSFFISDEAINPHTRFP